MGAGTKARRRFARPPAGMASSRAFSTASCHPAAGDGAGRRGAGTARSASQEADLLQMPAPGGAAPEAGVEAPAADLDRADISVTERQGKLLGIGEILAAKRRMR